MTNTIMKLIVYNEITCFKYLNQVFLGFLGGFFLFYKCYSINSLFFFFFFLWGVGWGGVSLLQQKKHENMILPNRFSFDGVKYPNALKIICCSDSVGTELPILPTICSLATELLCPTDIGLQLGKACYPCSR